MKKGKVVRTKKKKQDTLWGYLFIAPAILGLLMFFIGPMLFSLVISFTEWDTVRDPVFVGLANFKRVFTEELPLKSLGVTFYYTLLAVPLMTIFAIAGAMLLNTNIKGQSIFRTLIYIPSIVPMIASTVLWKFIYAPDYGFINSILKMLGLPTKNFLYDSKLVIPSLAVMAVWGVGNTVIIYLAGLQGISQGLYEAVEIDGGNAFHKFRYITLPMLSPVIFFNVIMGIISSMQTFAQPYVMTKGGPNNASMFITLLIYKEAFNNQSMGYAAALSWILTLVIGVMSFIGFRSSSLWVFNEGDDGK